MSGCRPSAPGPDLVTARRLLATAAWWLGCLVGLQVPEIAGLGAPGLGWRLLARALSLLTVGLWLRVARAPAWEAAWLAPVLTAVAILLSATLAAPARLLTLTDQPGGLEGPWRIRGVVQREPEAQRNGSRGELGVGQVRVAGTWLPTDGIVAVSVDEPRNPELAPGTQIETFLAMRVPRPPLNPRQRPRAPPPGVDARASLKSYRQVRIRSAGDTHAWLARARNGIRRQIGESLGPSAPLGMALLLGERGRVADQSRLTMSRTGLAHLLAISGLHLSIAVGAAIALARLAGGSPRLVQAVGVVAAVILPMVVVPRAAVVRAAGMACLALGSRALGRRVEALDCLAAALFVILLVDPASSSDPGLWLSVAAVLGILLATGGRRARTNRIAAWVATPLAAQAAAAPILATFGAQVAAGGALLNLLGVPLLATIMPVLALSVACGLAGLDWLSTLLGELSGRGLEALVGLASWGAGLPGVVVTVPSPSAAAALLWWIGLACAFVVPGRLRPRARRNVCRAAGLALAAMAAALATRPPRPPATHELIVLDVGQGDALLLRSAAGAVLLDAGGYPGIDYDVGAHVVAPALRRLGIGRLAVLAGSHPHADHYGGLPAVRRLHGADELWLGPSPSTSRLQDALLSSGGPGVALTPMAARRIAGCTWTPQVPPARELAIAVTRVSNAASLVLAVACGERRLLLTGDAGLAAEPFWRLDGLHGGILKVGHHGSLSATGADLLERLRPRHAIVSVGIRNSFGLPRDEVMRRLRALPAAVYRTDRDGALTVRLGSRVRVSGTRWRAGP